MGDVIAFKRRESFHTAAAQSAGTKPAVANGIVGYHDFQSLRQSGVHFMYRSHSSGDVESVDLLLVRREGHQKAGLPDTPEMHLKDNDYLYYLLCDDADALQYVESGRIKELSLRYDEETFTPILCQARFDYMRKNWSIPPATKNLW